jgi:hypothetical protein
VDGQSANEDGPAAGTSSAPSQPSAVDRVSLEVVGTPVQERAHTDKGDAIASSRRRLPMVDVHVEVNAHLTLTEPDRLITVSDAFERRRHGL